ncbi:Putative Peroxisomal long-chain acyl-CoA transporter [Rhizopus microsporus]|nr:Putative Peroxisomal long-chain acyl-CoA transporter [Rhizopus microsporus]
MPLFSKPVDTWFRKNKLNTSLLFIAILSLHHIKKYYTTRTKRDDFPLMDTQQQKVGVNKQFLQQLESISTILFPHWRTKETFLLILHSIFLVLRTYLSVVVARLDGRIVKDLVNGHGKRFLKGLLYWFAIAIPATYTNSMIRYFQSKLSIGFRTRLTNYIHELYLDNQKTFYKVLNLDNRIQGADQFITTDVARFCETLSSLYSNLAKPILDTIIFNYQLTKSIGFAGFVGLTLNYIITARLLRAVTPSFGKLAAIEAKLEVYLFRLSKIKYSYHPREISALPIPV